MKKIKADKFFREEEKGFVVRFTAIKILEQGNLLEAFSIEKERAKRTLATLSFGESL